MKKLLLYMVEVLVIIYYSIAVATGNADVHDYLFLLLCVSELLLEMLFRMRKEK